MTTPLSCAVVPVNRTGDIGLFKITSEGGVSAGVPYRGGHRQGALDYVDAGEARLAEAELLWRQRRRRGREDPCSASQKQLEREPEAVKVVAAGATADLLGQAAEVAGVKVLAAWRASTPRPCVTPWTAQAAAGRRGDRAGRRPGRRLPWLRCERQCNGQGQGELLSHIASQIGARAADARPRPGWWRGRARPCHCTGCSRRMGQPPPVMNLAVPLLVGSGTADGTIANLSLCRGSASDGASSRWGIPFHTVPWRLTKC